MHPDLTPWDLVETLRQLGQRHAVATERLTMPRRHVPETITSGSSAPEPTSLGSGLGSRMVPGPTAQSMLNTTDETRYIRSGGYHPSLEDVAHRPTDKPPRIDASLM
jgi:hypothetical protein